MHAKKLILFHDDEKINWFLLSPRLINILSVTWCNHIEPHSLKVDNFSSSFSFFFVKTFRLSQFSVFNFSTELFISLFDAAQVPICFFVQVPMGEKSYLFITCSVLISVLMINTIILFVNF